MMPPISRAIEKEGVFRNPMANATPEGIHFAQRRFFLEADVLVAESSAKRAEKIIINLALFSGNCPSPVNH